jgi:hypothetical protein
MMDTREQNIVDWAKRSEVDTIHTQYPDVDFKSSVMEPTVNFSFDILVYSHSQPAPCACVSSASMLINRAGTSGRSQPEEVQRLYGKVMEATEDPTEMEKILWDARACLQGYPDVPERFDVIFVKKGSMAWPPNCRK